VIVIDASSLAKYLLRERNWEVIENYLVKTVYSMDHIVKEVSNAIWKHVVLYRRIESDLGLQLYKQLKRLIHERIIVLENQEQYLDKAIELAIRYRATIYDTLYIAQALRYGELLTSDKIQAEIAKELNINTHYIE